MTHLTDEFAREVVRVLVTAGCRPGEGKPLAALWQKSQFASLQAIEQGVQRAATLGWVEQRQDNSFVLLTARGESHA